jgi:hypothetical protein
VFIVAVVGVMAGWAGDVQVTVAVEPEIVSELPAVWADTVKAPLEYSLLLESVFAGILHEVASITLVLPTRVPSRYTRIAPVKNGIDPAIIFTVSKYIAFPNEGIAVVGASTGAGCEDGLVLPPELWVA